LLRAQEELRQERDARCSEHCLRRIRYEETNKESLKKRPAGQKVSPSSLRQGSKNMRGADSRPKLELEIGTGEKTSVICGGGKQRKKEVASTLDR